jgi:hypothetical protein
MSRVLHSSKVAELNPHGGMNMATLPSCGAAKRRVCCVRGQAPVEVIGLLPLLLAVGLAAFSLLSAGAAREAAGGAAEAGAVAVLQGRDGAAAARAALSDWPPRRTKITLSGRRVTVRVTPRGPLGAHLRATSTAYAGPAPAPARPTISGGGG